MIELSITAKSATVAAPATPVPSGAGGGFARALGALADAVSAPAVATDARQYDADGGKKLPAPAPEPAQDLIATSSLPTANSLPAAKSSAPPRLAKVDIDLVGAVPVPVVARPTDGPASSDVAPARDSADVKANDDDKTPAAPALAVFMPPPPIPIEPIAPPVSVGGTGPRRPSPDKPGVAPVAPAGTAPAKASEAAAALAAPVVPGVTSAVPPTGATALPGAVELLDPGAAALIATPTTNISTPTSSRITASAGTPRFNLAATMTLPVDPAPAAVQPARQAFAAALAALSARAPARDDDSADPKQTTVDSIAGLLAPTGGTLIEAAVVPVADGQGATLDLRHDHGLRGMIDHIEALRDDANARDTRIRLVPDALGTVDVAVRRDGDAVHVRFSSANEATRIVLNDAQPRLAQLAEAGGLRIAGSSVDSGAGGGQPRPQTPNPTPRRARMSRIGTSRAADTATDQRLA